MNPLPFDKMIDPVTKRLKNRKVNVDGEGYESARRYMTRLEKKDFKDPAMLAKLADDGQDDADGDSRHDSRICWRMSRAIFDCSLTIDN